MHVVKKDGTHEPFDKSKIAHGCKKAGASEHVAHQVADAVAKKVKDGMKTTKIGEMVIAELAKHDKKTAGEFKKYFQASLEKPRTK